MEQNIIFNKEKFKNDVYDSSFSLANFADFAESAEEVLNIADNVASFIKNTKTLIERSKADTAFFNAVSTLSNFLPVFEKNCAGIILETIGDAGKLGSVITKVRDEYIENEKINSESRDEIVYIAIKTAGTLLKTVSLALTEVNHLIPAITILPFGGADLVTAILKDSYEINSEKNKSWGAAFVDYFFERRR